METKNVFHAGEFLSAIADYISEMGEAVDKQVKKLMTEEASDAKKAVAGLEKSEVNEFKKIFTNQSLPDEVYVAFIKRIKDYSAPLIDLSVTDTEGVLVKKFDVYIKDILDKNVVSVIVAGKKYEISSPFGQTSGYVKISVDDGKEYDLYFANNERSQKALKNFIDSLVNWSSDYRYAVYAGILEDTLSTIIDTWIDYLKSKDSLLAADVVKFFKDCFDIEEENAANLDTLIIKFLKIVFPNNADKILDKTDTYNALENMATA